MHPRPKSTKANTITTKIIKSILTLRCAIVVLLAFAIINAMYWNNFHTVVPTPVHFSGATLPLPKVVREPLKTQSPSFQQLFHKYNEKDESLHATVMAMATHYDLATYKRFVGSLRYSGYKGHIIIGLAPNPDPIIVNYLEEKKATIKILSWMNCTYMAMDDKEDIFKETTCAYPYPDIKIRWSRFPLMRDWLIECTTCTGPILVADARDTVFQRNPFGKNVPKVEGLQLFQEHINQTTKHWLTEWPIRECKGVTYDQPMLCSGTTIGTRKTMINYLTEMYEEMKVWINDPKCRFNVNGDDQSIHNYLFYSGKFPKETTISIPNQMGGIVNTIGFHGSVLLGQYIRGTDNDNYPGASLPTTWISRTEFGLTNDHGLFVDFDGTTISPVVHQWDRFGYPYENWLRQQQWVNF